MFWTCLEKWLQLKTSPVNLFFFSSLFARSICFERLQETMRVQNIVRQQLLRVLFHGSTYFEPSVQNTSCQELLLLLGSFYRDDVFWTCVTNKVSSKHPLPTSSSRNFSLGEHMCWTFSPKHCLPSRSSSRSFSMGWRVSNVPRKSHTAETTFVNLRLLPSLIGVKLYFEPLQKLL